MAPPHFCFELKATVQTLHENNQKLRQRSGKNINLQKISIGGPLIELITKMNLSELLKELQSKKKIFHVLLLKNSREKFSRALTIWLHIFFIITIRFFRKLLILVKIQELLSALL